MWDLRNLAEPVFATEKTGAAVHSVSFDFSGCYVAAAGQDVQVYSVAQDNKLEHVVRLSGHTGSVTGLAWGKDARGLCTVSTDKTLKWFQI